MQNWLVNSLEYFRKVWFLWAASLILNIITFLLIFYKINPGNKTLALHYNVIVGVEWYGKGNNLYFIPAIGLIVLIANYVLYKALKRQHDFLAFLTTFAAVSVELFLLIATVFLVRIN